MSERRLQRWPLVAPAVCGVGSLPHRTASAAAAFVLEHCAAARFVPELPNSRSGRDMITATRDAPRTQERGLTNRIGRGAAVLKVQVCGPATYAKQMGVSLRAAERLVTARLEGRIADSIAVAPETRLIVVLDEPHLGGSSPRDPAVDSIRRSLRRVRRLGAIAGIHCCDEVDARVISALDPDSYWFDAWNGLEATFATRAFVDWLRRGRLLALGIVPTLPVRTTATILANRIRAALTAARIDLRSQPTLLTGACGFGRSSLAWTERAHRLLAKTAHLLTE